MKISNCEVLEFQELENLLLFFNKIYEDLFFQ